MHWNECLCITYAFNKDVGYHSLKSCLDIALVYQWESAAVYIYFVHVQLWSGTILNNWRLV